MTKLRVLAPAVLLALALAGCAGHTGPAADATDTSSAPATSAPSSATPTQTTVTGSPTATPSATPTATETPAAATPPALSDLALSSEGLDYVKVGQPVPDHDSASAIVQWKQPYCEGADADGPGAWKTLYPKAENGNLAFYVEATEKTEPVTIIYIISTKIETEHGLHKGSTVAKVKALGGTEAKDVGGGIEAWVIHGNQGELVAFVGDGKVQQLQVQEEGSKPAYHLEITPCA
jgi:hypothetical protein